MSVPAAPSNLTVTAVDQNDIRLNWQDNSSNETGFEINNGVVSRDAGANSTTYTWGGLAPGTYMCFKIRSYNSAGDSAWDPNVSPYYVCTTTPKPPGASPPAAPSNLTVTAVDQHDIRLNWQDNSSNETGFEINNGVVSRDAGANSTTYTWGGLAPGTYMCFKIRSYNSASDSAWDPNVSPYYVCTTTPKPAPPVAQPTIYWSRTSGRPGTHLTLIGNGWVPGGTVRIHLPSKGFFYGSVSWPVDSQGGWKQNFTVGNTPRGTYTLSFSETSGHLLVTGIFTKKSLTPPVYCLGGTPGQACTGGSTSGGKPKKITVPKVPSEPAKTLSPAKLAAAADLVSNILKIIKIIVQIPGETLPAYFVKALACGGLTGAYLLQCVQNTGFPQAPITKT